MGRYARFRSAIRKASFAFITSSSRGLQGRQTFRAERLQLLERLREVLEEDLLVLGVLQHVLLELGVLDERDVGRKHHQVSRRVAVLELSLLVVRGPLQTLEQHEVRVVEQQRRPGPRTDVPRGVRVASPQSVRAGQSDNLAIAESHAVKNVS